MQTLVPAKRIFHIPFSTRHFNRPCWKLHTLLEGARAPFSNGQRNNEFHSPWMECIFIHSFVRSFLGLDIFSMHVSLEFRHMLKSFAPTVVSCVYSTNLEMYSHRKESPRSRFSLDEKRAKKKAMLERGKEAGPVFPISPHFHSIRIPNFPRIIPSNLSQNIPFWSKHVCSFSSPL